MLSTVGRPKEHGPETRVALLDAAERIAESEGVAAVSVRRLADEVSTTTRAVYSLFGSKEGLIVALGVRGFELLRANLASQRLTSNAVADMAIAGLAFRAFATQHPALFRISVLRDVPDPILVRQFATAGNETFATLTGRVQVFVDRAGLTHLDVYEAAVQYHALCEGLAGVELRGVLVESDQFERIWRDTLARLVAGFLQPPPRRGRPRRSAAGNTTTAKPSRG